VLAHIDNFWLIAESEAHTILFPSPETKQEDRLSELRVDMPPTHLQHAVEDMLNTQMFLHVFAEGVCSIWHNLFQLLTFHNHMC